MNAAREIISCEHFTTSYCRSCALLSLARTTELERKRELVETQVAAGLLSSPNIAEIWAPSRVFPSRSKAKIQVSGSVTAPVLGLMTFDGRNVENRELLDCPLHLPPINNLLKYLAGDLIPNKGLTPYDPRTRTGELKGIIILSNATASEMILRFICNSINLQRRIRESIPLIRSAFASVCVVSLNVQPVPHAVLEGAEEVIFTEQKSIREDYGIFSVELGPQSFKQVTHETAAALYRKSQELASRFRPKQLLDLYCGSGAFSLALAPEIEKGLGVEISADAVACARKSAEQFPHLSFRTADLLSSYSSIFEPNPDLIMLNPPRRGLPSELIAAIRTRQTGRVFYSSCNPQTLARDLKLFEPEYRVRELYPFDMFPLTEHLEVLAVLEHQSIANDCLNSIA